MTEGPVLTALLVQICEAESNQISTSGSLSQPHMTVSLDLDHSPANLSVVTMLCLSCPFAICVNHRLISFSSSMSKTRLQTESINVDIYGPSATSPPLLAPSRKDFPEILVAKNTQK